MVGQPAGPESGWGKPFSDFVFRFFISYLSVGLVKPCFTHAVSAFSVKLWVCSLVLVAPLNMRAHKVRRLAQIFVSLLRLVWCDISDVCWERGGPMYALPREKGIF